MFDLAECFGLDQTKCLTIFFQLSVNLEFMTTLLFCRLKRSAPSEFTKYLEVLIVADTSVVDFVGKDKIKAYIMGLMNIVRIIQLSYRCV